MTGHELPPGVGDLVADRQGGAKLVCTDILSAGTPLTTWVLRPLYGSGPYHEQRRLVGRRAIRGYRVLRRRGAWARP